MLWSINEGADLMIKANPIIVIKEIEEEIRRKSYGLPSDFLTNMREEIAVNDKI
jgi:hypothetical protein